MFTFYLSKLISIFHKNHLIGNIYAELSNIYADLSNIYADLSNIYADFDKLFEVNTKLNKLVFRFLYPSFPIQNINMKHYTT